MTAADLVAQAAAEGVALSIKAGGLACLPPATGALRDALREHKAEVLALLEGLTPVESQAIRDGWQRNPDGSWEFPAGWAALYPRTPDGEAIDAEREANCVALPADEEPRPALGPPTDDERAAVRARRLPAGVSYGQTSTGQWRRLT